MPYGAIAAVGAGLGLIGPVAWALALRAGNHIADGSGVLDAIVYIFPCSILFLGFPQADPAHPRTQIAALLVVGLVNATVFALLAIALASGWHLLSELVGKE